MLVSHNVQKKLPTLVINRLWTYDVRQLQLCSPANARHHLYNLSAADMTCTECEPFGCPQSPEKKNSRQSRTKANGLKDEWSDCTFAYTKTAVISLAIVKCLEPHKPPSDELIVAIAEIQCSTKATVPAPAIANCHLCHPVSYNHQRILTQSHGL